MSLRESKRRFPEKGGDTRRLFNVRFVVLLLVIGFGFAIAPQGAEAQTRPTPMGVWGGNPALQYGAKDCYYTASTLGALVADQVGTQYILSAAHVLAFAPEYPFFGSGSNEPIIQPSLGHINNISYCSQITPALISQYQVASLTTVVPLVYGGTVNSADAAIAKVIPGMVSSSISYIPQFSGVPLTVVKKGMLVQMTGAATGNTPGRVISKMLMVDATNGCKYITTTGEKNAKSCGFERVAIGNSFEFAGKNQDGDSGALVLTQGPCPQPVGVFVSGDPAARRGYAESISTTLQALKSAGGYSSLSVVPGGGGCTPTTAEVEDANGDVSLEDPTVPDPDVAEALVARADMLSNDSNLTVLTYDGYVDGVGIDLSFPTASLDVIFDSASDLDVYGSWFPTSYEGVPVEETVINVVDTSGDSTDFGSLPN